MVDDGYLFHGGNDEFDVFDPEKASTNTSRQREGYGAYFTDSAYKCEEYGRNFIILDSSGLDIMDWKDKIPNPVSRIEVELYRVRDALYSVRTNDEYDYYTQEEERLEEVLESLGKFKRLSNAGDTLSIHDVLSFAYNSIGGDGMKQAADAIRILYGVDGYKADNVYVFINFDAINSHIVKDKESLIMQYANKL